MRRTGYIFARGGRRDERARADLPGRLDRALLGLWGRLGVRLPVGMRNHRLRALYREVEAQGPAAQTWSDAELRGEADAIRAGSIRRDAGVRSLVRAFTLAREATRRVLGKVQYPVQIMGGFAMLRGALVEMQTGEGKTLTAVLPATAAALSGRSVHIITVNDYLARRDAEQLGPIYRLLGLTVGLVEQGQSADQRRTAYRCDVVYCTNKELVFDHLRDRLRDRGEPSELHRRMFRLVDADAPHHDGALIPRGLQFAIIDEADSVLIDEARVPLILSDAADDGRLDASMIEAALDVARELRDQDDFSIIPGNRQIEMTAHGDERVDSLTSGWTGPWSMRRARRELVTHALAALHLYRRDVHYIVAEGKVQIVDEFTGRTMPDRSWERSLHQLIESKEGCLLSERRQTVARITYQRFFRRYSHLCGMTGTAAETAAELMAIYGLEVVRIPTHRPIRRRHLGTQTLASEQEKLTEIARSVRRTVGEGRAILIGTRSVQASERVGAFLAEHGVECVVLNARQDEDEAAIVAGAGLPGRIVVATNMAGRGTDIELHPDVARAGGLHVVLTEFHESVRVDRQLFGRCGRQGDPGTCEAIVSLEDELFQRYAAKGMLAVNRRIDWLGHTARILLGRLLRLQCQASAERSNSRIRLATLEEDLRLDKALRFAGDNR
jgi:preprotein translocase subunit SecA